MQNTLTFQDTRTKIQFHSFDSDKEIEICMLDSDDNTLGLIYLTANNINDIVSHFSEQLKSVNEPIEFITNNK